MTAHLISRASLHSPYLPLSCLSLVVSLALSIPHSSALASSLSLFVESAYGMKLDTFRFAMHRLASLARAFSHYQHAHIGI